MFYKSLNCLRKDAIVTLGQMKVCKRLLAYIVGCPNFCDVDYTNLSHKCIILQHTLCSNQFLTKTHVGIVVELLKVWPLQEN